MLMPSPLRGRLGLYLAGVVLTLVVQAKPVSADAIVIYDFTGQITQQTGINVGLGSASPPEFAGSITYTVPGGGVVTNLSPSAQAYGQPQGNIYAIVFAADGMSSYPLGLNYPTPKEPNASVPQLTLNTSTNQLNYTFQIANGGDAFLTTSFPKVTVGPTKMSLTVAGINSLNLGQLNLLSLGATPATLQIQGQIIGTNTTPFSLSGTLTTLTLDAASDSVPVTGGQTVNSPEPGALVLLASSSMVGLVFWRRKRRSGQESSAS